MEDIFIHYQKYKLVHFFKGPFSFTYGLLKYAYSLTNDYHLETFVQIPKGK